MDIEKESEYIKKNNISKIKRKKTLQCDFCSISHKYYNIESNNL